MGGFANDQLTSAELLITHIWTVVLAIADFPDVDAVAIVTRELVVTACLKEITTKDIFIQSAVTRSYSRFSERMSFRYFSKFGRRHLQSRKRSNRGRPMAHAHTCQAHSPCPCTQPRRE